MCCPPPPRPPRCPTRVGSLTHHVRNCVYTHCWMPHATWERREGGQPRVVACCVGGCGGWPPLLDILNSVATPPCHPSPPLSPLPTHGLHFVWKNNTIVSWGPCQHALASSSSQGQGEPGVLPCGRVGVRNPPPHTVARRTLAPRAPWTQAPPCAPVHMIAFLTVCTAKGWVAWPSHGPPPRKWHTQVTTNPNAQLCARPTHGGPHDACGGTAHQPRSLKHPTTSGTAHQYTQDCPRQGSAPPSPPSTRSTPLGSPLCCHKPTPHPPHTRVPSPNPRFPGHPGFEVPPT
jgi:hypothetical protein